MSWSLAPARRASPLPARAGTAAKVGVVDDNPTPGGQIWRGGKPPAGDRLAIWLQSISRMPKSNASTARRLLPRLSRRSCWPSANGEPIELHYDKLILATGARERFLPFPGWTLPNVIGAGGLQALLKAGLPVEGKRVVVAGSGPLLALRGRLCAAARRDRLPLVAEQAPWRRVAAFGAQLLWLGLEQALAGGRLSLVAAEHAISDGLLADGRPRQREGRGRDAPVAAAERGPSRATSSPAVSGWFRISNCRSLLGCEVRDGAVVVDARQESSVPGVYCAGEITGIGGAELAVVEGQIAGLAAVGKTAEAARLFAARFAAGDSPRPWIARSGCGGSCVNCPTTIHSYAGART